MKIFGRKFNLYQEPSYEVYDIRVLDDTGNTLYYLHKCAETDTPYWSKLEDGRFTIKGGNVHSDTFQIVRRLVLNIYQDTSVELIKLIKDVYPTIERIEIVARSIPRMEDQCSIMMVL